MGERTPEEAIAHLRKTFGESIIQTLADKPLDVPVVPTGSLALDIALGIGGVPRGRITELYGPEGAGKTTILQHIVAEAQRLGGRACLIDMEHDVDLAYMAACGVDVDAVLFSQPDDGAQALDVAEALIRDDTIDVVAIDSVASLVPPAEMKMTASDQSVGLQARMMSQWLRKIKPLLGLSRTALVFTNQLREKIGVMFGSPETTPGGRALKFHASVRMDVRKVAMLGKKDDRQGISSRVRVIKNKCAPPWKTATIDILWGQGINREGDVLSAATNAGVVELRGSHFYYKGESMAQGREGTRAYLAERPELVEEIRNAVLSPQEETSEDQDGADRDAG